MIWIVGTYMKYNPTTTSIVIQSTLTTLAEVERQSKTVMVVAIATVLLALVMSVLLAIYLYRNHRKAISECSRTFLAAIITLVLFVDKLF